MGLLTSFNNLNYTLEEEKRNKKLEQIKRQKERQQKEDLKRYKNEIEIYLKKEFDNYFIIGGSGYIVEFYNRERKKEISDSCGTGISWLFERTADRRKFCEGVYWHRRSRTDQEDPEGCGRTGE